MQAAKKRQRVGSSNRLASLSERPIFVSDHKPGSSRVEYVELDSDGNSRRAHKRSIVFNDPATADVVLFLHPHLVSSAVMQDVGDLDAESILTSSEVYLHARVLEQCRYFATVLSERWQDSRHFSEGQNHEKRVHINMKVPASRGVDPYLLVLQLFYSKDFQGVIVDVSTALACLPVAAELLYDECITACVNYLEAVPWTEEEENRVVELVYSLQLGESTQLLARVLPVNNTAAEDMLSEVVYAATHSHPNGATVKAFVARLLTEYESVTSVKLVLDRAFASSLKIVKDSVEEYSSPNVRGRYDEIEALQRMNLHTASVNGKHLVWLVERMIELRVAENAVKEWSDQGVFVANLKKAFNDNIAPSLPSLVLRCTYCFANAVAAGSILASCQVRMNLVKEWLPLLLVSRDNPSPAAAREKLLHHELEVVFLRIISTLPFGDAQTLLPQCLSFATRSKEDCSHLVSAFSVWFRRAGRLTMNTNDGEGCDHDSCDKAK